MFRKGKCSSLKDRFSLGDRVPIQPRSEDMQDSERGIIVGRKRTVKGIVGMRADQNIVFGKACDYQSVIEFALLILQLDHVSQLNASSGSRVLRIGP